MPIETICPGCGRKLRVVDEHAGRQARCPMCSTIYTVPGGRTSETVADASPGRGKTNQDWRMRTPEGQTFGPVAKQELDRWVFEGRITADCQLHSDSLGGWHAADAVYPVLQSPPQRAAPSGNPFCGPAVSRGSAFEPAAQSRAPVPARTRHAAAHRGGLILALGIISWVVGCPIFGIMAWAMGSSDLREMRLGRMDPSGTGLTQAGQIIGMIHVMIVVVLLVLVVFVILLGLAAS